MNKLLILASALILSAGCSETPPSDNSKLTDNNINIGSVIEDSEATFIFEGVPTPVHSYVVYSSGETPSHDPASWSLYGMDENGDWKLLDTIMGVEFCSRFQGISRSIDAVGAYSTFKLVIVAHPDSKAIAINEVKFLDMDSADKWANFKYPEVKFSILDPATKGAEIYGDLVQDPDEYIRYHTCKVAEILFYSDADSMNTVGVIDYQLKDYEGVSAKSGTPAYTTIVYSTQHIEKAAAESMAYLDFETRGVLFHELVHAYQFEPKGIGSYSTNKEFWACIEGLADAVRSEAGFFDIEALRKPGGHWLDGYKTTGFFIQWLKTLDPDAIRKFHITVRELDVWSFDKAMQIMFGKSIEDMWREYQQFLHNA